ncbi:MAG TPA: BTAD domain-containing putative transcriptional regulator, partial [Longimicrobiales bacterium]|nr:BTAD domain-containing putative transcriptional regulator [Longimicrobiales bacterium]
MSLRIDTFGGLRVFSDGSEIALPVQRRTRTALLVYLALERDVSRDTVASIFWPESDAERAHHCLSQALYQLRQILGDEWLLVHGDRIRCLSTVHTDAEEFERQVATGDCDAALQLYRAPFLAGVDNLPNSKPFEMWMDGRRARYERLHRSARRARIDACVAASDTSAAIATARAWVQVDAADDEAQHRLIALLAANGQESEALAQYAVYERLLAGDDLQPLDQTKALAAELRSHPFADLPVRETIEPPPHEHVPQERRDPHARFRARGVHVRIGLPIFSGLVLLAVGWALIAAHASRSETLDTSVVAVLPFTALSNDPEIANLGEGMAVLLASRLNGEAGLKAAEPQSVFAQLTRLSPDLGTPLTTEAGVAVATRLRAGRLLRGSIVATLGRITVTASLVDANSGKQTAAASVEGPTDSLMPMVDRLTAQLLGLAAGESEDRLAGLTSASFRAVQAYLRGEAKFRRGLASEAADEYESALNLDSTFALAALRLHRTVGWAGMDTPERMQRTERLACKYRDRLSPRDRTSTMATLLCDQPSVTVHDVTRAIDRAAAQAGDDPELWQILGDRLFHLGALSGEKEWSRRSVTAMQRALELGHPYPWEGVRHLLEFFATTRDTAALRATA